MLLTFLEHQRKSFWRGRNKGAGIVSRVVMVILMGYFILVAIGAGLFMEPLIRKIFPQADVLAVFNGFVLYYFMFDFLIRIQMQELPTIAVKPYLHLNVRRRSIVNFLNLRALFSPFNFIPAFLLLPFCLSYISSNAGGTTALLYVVAIVSGIIFNNYLVLYLKRRSISNILFVAAGVAIIGALAALEYFKLISISTLANDIFATLSRLPATVLGFILLAVAMYFINARYLRRNLYLEELSRKEEPKASTDYPFFNRFGKAGELAALELKLILRHKRSRSSLFMGLVFLAYGFLFYKAPLIENDQFASMLFAAVFITGITVIMYGQFMFAWQSAHFDGILANKISLHDFIRAKFLLFTIGCTIIAILSTFYGLLSWKLLLLHLAAYLYNIGFGTVIVLWFATMNYKRLDLSKGASFNWQGVSAVQWILGIPLLVLPFIIYLPFGVTDHPYWGLIAIALFGLITLLMRNWWIKGLTKILIKKRYKIAEGFRE